MWTTRRELLLPSHTLFSAIKTRFFALPVRCKQYTYFQVNTFEVYDYYHTGHANANGDVSATLAFCRTKPDYVTRSTHPTASQARLLRLVRGLRVYYVGLVAQPSHGGSPAKHVLPDRSRALLMACLKKKKRVQRGTCSKARVPCSLVPCVVSKKL